MSIEVTEDLIRAVTTKDKALSDGRTLSKKRAYTNVRRTEDGSLLWGECQGSGAKPYELSVDLAGDTPILRCTCPVKPPPCKHTLGFLVHFMESGGAFAVAEGPAELLDKRAKTVERAERRAEAAAKPKEINVAAAKKKAEAQRMALDDLLEPLLVDAVKSGIGSFDARKTARLATEARKLHDAYLPGAAERLLRLASILAPADTDGDAWEQTREPGWDLPEERRFRLAVRHAARLWAVLVRGRKLLDEKIEEGESEAEADAVVEELLGRVWKLEELRAKGHERKDLTLLELAFERYDDFVREERIEQSFLLDLGDGAVHVERTYRPLDRMDRMKEGESYEKPLLLSDAVLYPGFVNRRIRWEIAARRSRGFSQEDFARIHEVALPGFDALVAKLKEQLKNPLAPDDAVVLVRIADARRARAKESIVVIDAAGKQLVLEDAPLARYRTVGNFTMAAGAALDDAGRLAGPASLLVRAFASLEDGGLRAQPLAFVQGRHHIRLGS